MNKNLQKFFTLLRVFVPKSCVELARASFMPWPLRHVQEFLKFRPSFKLEFVSACVTYLLTVASGIHA